MPATTEGPWAVPSAIWFRRLRSASACCSLSWSCETESFLGLGHMFVGSAALSWPLQAPSCKRGNSLTLVHGRRSCKSRSQFLGVYWSKLAPRDPKTITPLRLSTVPVLSSAHSFGTTFYLGEARDHKDKLSWWPLFRPKLQSISP